MGLPHALNWELVVQDPSAFIPSMWLNHRVSNLAKIEFYDMPMIYHCLFKAQETDNAFHWISPKVPIVTMPVAIPATP